MSISTMTDKLPTYPSNIQGELRLILQTKDIFMICYKQLEEYRRLVNEQNRLITKEFVQEQLQVGEDEISELQMELDDAENKLAARIRKNELLAEQLSSQGLTALENRSSVRRLSLVRTPQMRKQMFAQRKADDDQQCSNGSRGHTHMIDNIALAIDEIHHEVRTNVKPLLDYYRDLFYLQLHFSLVLGQVCNYCMPLVTENIGLLERVFFWAERPEFELIRKASDISDRLKEIYTRSQQILGVLSDSVRFLQSKVELQKSLETRFHERMDEQQKIKDRILRDIHGSKQNMEMLEEDNDRLVGSLVKIDPAFVASNQFNDLAGGRHSSSKTTENSNNQQENGKNENNVHVNSGNFANKSNLSDKHTNLDHNNNKAASILGDTEDFVLKTKCRKKIKKDGNEARCGSGKSGKSSKFSNEQNEEGIDVERRRRRLRDHEPDGKRRAKRAATITGDRRTESNETLCRIVSKRDERSNSKRRSPSESSSIKNKSTVLKCARDRSANCDNFSEGQASDDSQIDNGHCSPVVRAQKNSRNSLKSRLLDRTKGLFDSSKTRDKLSSIKSCTEEFISEISLLPQHQKMPGLRKGSLSCSSSSIPSSPLAGEPVLNNVMPINSAKLSAKSSTRKIYTRKENSHDKDSRRRSDLPQLNVDMLTLDEKSNETSSHNRRRSKSTHENRWKLNNELADFLSTSASESLCSAENSSLPKF